MPMCILAKHLDISVQQSFHWSVRQDFSSKPECVLWWQLCSSATVFRPCPLWSLDATLLFDFHPNFTAFSNFVWSYLLLVLGKGLPFVEQDTSEPRIELNLWRAGNIEFNSRSSHSSYSGSCGWNVRRLHVWRLNRWSCNTWRFYSWLRSNNLRLTSRIEGDSQSPEDGFSGLPRLSGSLFGLVPLVLALLASVADGAKLVIPSICLAIIIATTINAASSTFDNGGNLLGPGLFLQQLKQRSTVFFHTKLVRQIEQTLSG